MPWPGVENRSTDRKDSFMDSYVQIYSSHAFTSYVHICIIFIPIIKGSLVAILPIYEGPGIVYIHVFIQVYV